MDFEQYTSEASKFLTELPGNQATLAAFLHLSLCLMLCNNYR